jgi:hypothetical protein
MLSTAYPFGPASRAGTSRFRTRTGRGCALHRETDDATFPDDPQWNIDPESKRGAEEGLQGSAGDQESGPAGGEGGRKSDYDAVGAPVSRQVSLSCGAKFRVQARSCAALGGSADLSGHLLHHGLEFLDDLLLLAGEIPDEARRDRRRPDRATTGLAARRAAGRAPLGGRHYAHQPDGPAKAKSFNAATEIYTFWGSAWATLGVLQGVPRR